MNIGLTLSMCGGSGGMAGINAQLATLLSSALIPTRDGVLTVTSDATVDPITGAAVGANTANGRTLNVGGYSFPGAALLAQRASSSLFGAATGGTGLASNSTSAGAYPSVRRIVEDATLSSHNAFTGSIVLTDGSNYVISAYIKAFGTGRYLAIYLDGGANRFGAIFDPVTGAPTSYAVGNGVVVRSSARLLASGYWLVQVTGNSPTWGGSPILQLRMNAAAAVANYTGDGVSGIDISGYKCELGEYATTPHNWDGGAISRQANLISWNQALSTTAGTVLAVGMPYGRSGTVASSSFPRLYEANLNGRMYVDIGTPRYSAQRVDTLAANNIVNTATSSPTAGAQKIVSQRFDAASNRITIDGITVSSAAPTTPFLAATPLTIGNDTILANPFDGWVALALFNTALSDSDVALITAYSSIV